jgi:hypothetical protein
MSGFSLTTEKAGGPCEPPGLWHRQWCFPRLIARVADVPRLLHGVDYLVEIVARGSLQRREGPVGLKLLQPQQLPNRQQVQS